MVEALVLCPTDFPLYLISMLEYPASMKGLLVVELDFSVCYLLHAVLRAGVLWLPGTSFQRAPAAVEVSKHSVWVWAYCLKTQERLVVPLADQSLQV